MYHDDKRRVTINSTVWNLFTELRGIFTFLRNRPACLSKYWVNLNASHLINEFRHTSVWGPGIDITTCLRCVYQAVGPSSYIAYFVGPCML